MKLNLKSISLILAGIVILFLAYSVMTMREDRTPGQKIGDAIDQLDNGVDDAARELEDRTPAEKVGDAVRDATDDE